MKHGQTHTGGMTDHIGPATGLGGKPIGVSLCINRQQSPSVSQWEDDLVRQAATRLYSWL